MKKLSKHQLSFAFISFFLLFVSPFFEITASANDKNLPTPSTEFYVYDEPNILSSETKKLIRDINLNYEETAEKPQIVVAVVQSLNGYPVEDYTAD